MSKFLAGLSGGSGITATVVVGAVAVAGTAAWVQFGPGKDTAVVPAVAKAPEAQTPTVQEPQADGQPAIDPVVAEGPAVPVPPAFDEVRREADGVTVIAGRAEPGAVIQILQNGVEIARSTADGSGKFAAIAMIPPDGKGHVLSLLQLLEGDQLASLDEVILAPLAAPAVNTPVVVADASTGEVQPNEAVQPEVAVQATPEAEATTEVAAISDATEGLDAEGGHSAVTEETVEPAQAPLVQAEVIETVTATPEVEVIVEAEAQASNEVSETTEAEAVVAEVQIEVADNSVKVAEAQVETTGAQAAVTDVQTDNSEAQTAVPGVTPKTEVMLAEVKETATEIAPKTVAEPEPVLKTAALVPEPSAEVPNTQPAPVAVLKSTAEGVELLNALAPEVMDNVALDTISYSQAGDVQLSGRAQTDTKVVRVYLDNDAIVTLNVTEDGRWRGDLPNVDQGIYTLRVDEVARDGKVTSRVETPFKREAPEVLAAASASQDGPIKAITVQKGATLWAIARERYGSGELYVRVFEANRDAIRDADLIYPGQIFDLPD